MPSPTKHSYTSATSMTFLFDCGENDTLSTNSSSTVKAEPSAAQKARERKLREDPMADVLGPLFVDCRRCGSRIKLSAKSPYDVSHWRTHRERCLKRQLRLQTKQQIAKPPPISTLSCSLVPSLEQPSSPLTPCDDDAISTHEHGEDETAPPLPSPSPLLKHTPTPRKPDLAFDEYLQRSNRKHTLDGSPDPQEYWRNWSWSQLLMPVFVACGDRHSENTNSSMNVSDNEARSRHEAAASLSLLSGAR